MQVSHCWCEAEGWNVGGPLKPQVLGAAVVAQGEDNLPGSTQQSWVIELGNAACHTLVDTKT